ncbi:hypothetical protein UPYG_G00063660 [Umbra pygmaea]|uniref:Uncharacterized protein n=1 Tax=Umbra pygmaea TaxID=75934 RepID=A0ABD0X9V8_UMBPY
MDIDTLISISIRLDVMLRLQPLYEPSFQHSPLFQKHPGHKYTTVEVGGSPYTHTRRRDSRSRWSNAHNSHVVFGLPWLCLHPPVINWNTHQITTWSTSCCKACLPHQLSPTSALQSTIPCEYQNFMEVFSTSHSTRLPPHRFWDCS